MTSQEKHNWIFSARFRRHAFGWRSQPAIKRIKEAVSEIKRIARKDPILGGEGAVIFLEKVSAAIEQVDSSSGAIGAAVNNAISELVTVIAAAPAEDALRNKWLDRLWKAVQEDDIPYIELLPDYWGELCVTHERASFWADSLIEGVKSAWSSASNRGCNYEGTSACFSSSYKAGRYNDILELLKMAPYKFWEYHRWGVRSLAAMGEIDKAIQYAEESRGLNDSRIAFAMDCEEILLQNDRITEAYDRYAISANQKTTYLATFRAIHKKYPSFKAEKILDDLIASTPGSEGKWFVAALSVKLFTKAIHLANLSPCDPRTLTNAAGNYADQEPLHAIEFGMAALFWLINGYGYEITNLDVRAAFDHTLKAAHNAGLEEEISVRIRHLISGDQIGDSQVAELVLRYLEAD